MNINLNDKIKLIKNIYNLINCSKQLINIITNSNKKSYIETKYNYYKLISIYVSKKIIPNLNYMLYICYNFKKYLEYIFKFIKFLFIYFIEKYYYETNNIDFVIKTLTNKDSFNFFIDLNKLKKMLTLCKEEENFFIKIIYYYTMTITACLSIGPFVWFLLRVLTDRMNWMLYFFEHTNFCLLL